MVLMIAFAPQSAVHHLDVVPMWKPAQLCHSGTHFNGELHLCRLPDDPGPLQVWRQQEHQQRPLVASMRHMI